MSYRVTFAIKHVEGMSRLRKVQAANHSSS